MKEKTLYVTEDGMEFENVLEAQEHEDKITKEKMNRNRIIKLDNGKKLSHDEIVEFFNKSACSECPFCKECDVLYQRYKTVTICNAINDKILDY